IAKIVFSWPVITIVILLIVLFKTRGQIGVWMDGLVKSVQNIKYKELEVTFLREKVAQQDEAIKQQQDVIDQLVIFSMSNYIFWHLNQMYHGQNDQRGLKYLFRADDNMRRDLRFLILQRWIAAAVKQGKLDRCPRSLASQSMFPMFTF